MKHSIRRVLTSVVVVVIVAGNAAAQFTVTSSTPAHGDLNVPTVATFSITFSAALDTTARFYPDDNFFLAIETWPEIPQPLSMGLSPDLTTFSALVSLQPDTQYMLWLTGARSQAGEPLAQPYTVTFTTGSSLPTGSVSGTITDASAGKAAEGTLVALFADDNGPFSEGGPVVATIAGTSGQYTLDFVGPGLYQTVAAGDANGDGLLEIQLGDTFGLYDGDGDGLLDVIDVADGEAVTGIDITVRVPAPVSAQAEITRATSAAKAVRSDAELVAVAGDLLPSGLSAFWSYAFYSAANLEHVGLIAVGGQFVLSPIEDLGGGVDVTTPLPAGWLDSDVVAAIAGDNGADEFFAAWPNVDAFGFAGNVTDPYGKRSAKAAPRRRGVFALSFNSEIATAKSARSLVVTPTPLWTFFYNGYDAQGGFDFLALVIHAVTGEVDPALAYYTAARENLAVANTAATSWAASVQLVSVESGLIGVHRSGQSSEWKYSYRSNANTAYEVVVQEGEVIYEGPTDIAFLRSTQTLPENWIDSPDASSTADVESGGFRDLSQNIRVDAVLAKDIDFNNPARSVWEFQYWDNFSGSSLTVLVDAETGLVVAAEDVGELPSSLRLEQNYPNPFNPSTTISFEVPVAGAVRLTVFDLLGRPVKTLVQGERTTGRHVVVWDGLDDKGKPVSSGIYMYKVEAGGTSATRSMTLLR